MGSCEDINLADAPIEVFEIYLQQDDYFPGEVMTGKLLVLTSKPIEVEGIFIKFEGKGVAKWQKRPSYLCGFQKAEFAAGKSILFTNVFRYDILTIPEGSSAFPFEFEVPTGLPQTIGDGVIMKRVKVTYEVEALIRTSADDYRQTKSFLVKGILNLNAFSELSLPVCRIAKEIIFESCWSPSGKVMAMYFSIKKQGFIPGEALVSELLVKDWVNEAALFSTVEVQLIQEVRLKVGNETLVKRRTLAKSETIQAETEEIARKCDKKFMLGLRVPEAIPISYGEGQRKRCDFISINYSLRMIVVGSSFPYKSIQTQIPITIGSIWTKARKAAPIQIHSTVPFVLPKPKVIPEQKPNPTNLHDISDLPNPLRFHSVPSILVNSASSHERLCTPPRTPKRKVDKNKKSSTPPSTQFRVDPPKTGECEKDSLKIDNDDPQASHGQDQEQFNSI